MPASNDQRPLFSSRERKICIVLIIVGVILIGVFGFRAVRSYIRLERMRLKPGTTDVEAIRGWMTIPYIARAYGVPRDYIFQRLNIPHEGNQDESLYHLQRAYDFDEQGAIVEAVKTAIQQYQLEYPPPEKHHDGL